MKFPKNRGNLYIVVREDIPNYGEGFGSVAILGCFSDLVEADNYKDSCASEWFDKVKTGIGSQSTFDIRLSTFYG
jgi:hypothetical protein